jgi:hypothetical protein
MNDALTHATQSAKLATNVGLVFRKRIDNARTHFATRASQALARLGEAKPAAPLEAGAETGAYWTDVAQRSILFWDTMRERGNRYLDNVRAGSPPVLHFEYEVVLDARTFARPVNYALLRILPPKGVKLDASLRPYVIIDPRAGHGPGIGGFKDDSQVGVALRAGHYVYFVMFYPDPQPGQTLLDVCEAERHFVREVRALHPKSAKPTIIGNCQGGWAAMMLASSSPEDTGPIVINGAPMSYWGGAWNEGEGDNPMRYAGGLLGGTWLASLVSDLGAGIFDGAHLVDNFENLNPANTYWDKYYQLFSKIDTEAPRFLDFERWWGAYYLMNREEIEWITQNLFVGNRLWAGREPGSRGLFDLRAIRVPIVLFASLGDNITPPEQAFNWVGDVYASTEDIKANGQVIIGLVHENVGHLGIFVSGKVAKKEYREIVSAMEAIEMLPPGLYAMKIDEKKDGGYAVSFEERELADVMKRLNRFERADEKAFTSAAAVSEFAQRAYEMFGRPLAQSVAHPEAARLARAMHPLRAQRWAFSDLNPWMAAIGPVAGVVRANRRALGAEAAPRRAEAYFSEMLSATLDFYREARDAASEAAFFQVYGHLQAAQPAPAAATPASTGESAVVQKALASIGSGGYPAAVARVAALLSRHGQPIPLARLDLKRELAAKYGDLIPAMPAADWRRLRGEQEIVAHAEPDRAVSTIAALLPRSADRARLASLLDRIEQDAQTHGASPSQDQRDTLARIRRTIAVDVPASRKPARRRAKAAA